MCISYGALIWGSNYKTKLKPIFILQKRALRAITFSDYRAPSKPIFERLQILNIYEIVQYQLGEIAFKYETNQIPTIFRCYFKNLRSVHNHNTRSRSAGNFYLSKQRLNYGKFGLKYAAAKVWNSIPAEIRKSSSNKIFKYLYKKHILS